MFVILLIRSKRISEDPNNAINSDAQKRRFALLLRAGYGERWASRLI